MATDSAVARSVAKEGGWAGVMNILGAGFRYLNNLILARVLGPAALGLFGLANAAVAIVAVFISLGLPTAMTHFLASYAGRQEWGPLRWVVRASIRTALVSGILGCAVVVALSPWASVAIFHKEKLVLPLAGLALSLPFACLYGVCAGGLQGLKDIRGKVFVERVAHPLLLFAFLLAGGFVFRSLFFVVVCFFVATAANLLIAAVWFTRRMKALPLSPSPVASRWRVTAGFSVPVMVMNLLTYLVLQSDLLVMGIFRPEAEVGIYLIASRLATGVGQPADALGASLAPNFSSLMGQGDHEGLRRLFHTSTRWIFLLGTGVGLTLILSGQLVLRIFGKDFTTGYVVLCLLAAGQMFSAALGANATLITMTGHPKVNLVNSLVLGLANLGLDFVLIPRYGAVGAAAAAAASLIAMNLTRSVEINVILKMRPWDRTLLKPLVALLSGAAAGWGAFWGLGPVAGTACGLAVFVGGWWTLGPEPEDLEMLRLALARLRRRPAEVR